VAPSAVSISRQAIAGAEPGTVDSVETRGDLVRVRVGDLAADLTPMAFSALDLAPGDQVWLSH
jgi:molybdate transport system ATP-binding protein